MAVEAVIVELLGNQGDPIDVTVASGTAITKGTLMKIGAARTGSLAAARSDPFIGIAAADKADDDYATNLAVYTHGIFDIVCSGAVPAGALVEMEAGANVVLVHTGSFASGGTVVGQCLETGAANTAAEILIGAGTR